MKNTVNGREAKVKTSNTPFQKYKSLILPFPAESMCSLVLLDFFLRVSYLLVTLPYKDNLYTYKREEQVRRFNPTAPRNISGDIQDWKFRKDFFAHFTSDHGIRWGKQKATVKNSILVNLICHLSRLKLNSVNTSCIYIGAKNTG